MFRPTASGPISRQALLQNQQVPGEIPAINRGHIFLRVERAQIVRVIPVEKMAVEHFHSIHCRQCGFDAIHELERAHPAEVACGNRREKIQADICGRSAVGNYGPSGIFLKIVRGKEMVFCGKQTIQRNATFVAQSSVSSASRSKKEAPPQSVAKAR